NPDVDNIYKVPLELEQENIDDFVLEELSLQSQAFAPDNRNREWRELVTQQPSRAVDIALVGKYALEDAYISIHEALKHAGLERQVDVNVLWVDSDEMASEHKSRLHEASGIVVPGGFGSRGTAGKIKAIEYARANDIPYLGLCFGFQLAVVEYARHVLGLSGAHSTEIDEDTPHPVIDLLPDQNELDEMGGTMRLGAHETTIKEGTLAYELYNDTSCTERHRHRYEVNPEYINQLETEGLIFSGFAGERMEILELDDHPFFFGTQFHPEYTSRPGEASPPFVGFLDAVLNYQAQEVEM
ncbi:MAG: CTP synthase, partial [Halobacteriaceae archaeon]